MSWQRWPSRVKSWAEAITAILALLSYASTHLPGIGPYLRTSITVPLWAALSALFLLGTAILVAVRVRGRQPKEMFYPFDHLGFRWEISSQFPKFYQSIEHPSGRLLDDHIKGPICAKCGRSLSHAEGTYLYRIEDPCTKCGRKRGEIASGAQLINQLTKMKEEVYREVQRQARNGQFPPH